MTRVFVAESALSGPTVTITGEDAHHLATVMRLVPGDHFTAITPDGRAHEVVISAAHRREVSGEIIRSYDPEPEAHLRLTLYQAIPKGKRFPFILQKCTELGVARFVPILTARTVVDVSERDEAQRVERWTKIVREACQQCGRATVPQVSAPLTWKQALQDWQANDAPGLIFNERLAAAPRPSLRAILAEMCDTAALSIFIGPEGGFTRDEGEAAVEAGLIETPLGGRILRVETAAIVAAALCLYEAGDI